MNWIDALKKLHYDSYSYVLVTVLQTRGSSPRDTGTKMVVSRNRSYDTIGGGALEFEVIQIARDLLDTDKTQDTRVFNLGKDLKQCCGGVVEVFFEVFNPSQFHIALFGAGHIGKAIATILSEVDCRLSWFDSRNDQFPETSGANVRMIVMDKPEIAVENCPPNTHYLVMTHDHALDQQLCEAIISRSDSQYCGLIGSTTKGLKFRQRFVRKGFNKQELDKLICPVGLGDIKSKKPMEIAVSVCAELLQIRDKVMLETVQGESKVISLGKNSSK